MPGTALPPGILRIEGADRLHELLSEADCVAICCQWTPETTKLMGREALDAMKPGTILVNVARAEIIDEAALLKALDAGKLRGVALDVYEGEFEREPDRRLWDHERVLITLTSQAAAICPSTGASNSFAKICARIWMVGRSRMSSIGNGAIKHRQVGR
jgi:phosphoglycerate dehydrogenase-like enzyme